ncbi:Os08g0555800 [Oryza sativa Japonica Group]|uniref:Os08g0555800 protein n=1 Tax=Oryza sativa subsp. japonica TaxID=39947 RepID=Q0J3T0_ORYSJ|nr:Os08g0555800 [Oryza sativa Japonica Group]|eukprot:NP_001062471.2 Os08g0555800 [Oryza sativa Japonica Group]
MAPPASRPPTPTPTPTANAAASSSRIESPSLRAALAMALIHYNRLPSRAAAAAAPSPQALLNWKRKAKDRKREILRLREELKLLQDGARGEEMEPPVASCRCHFFDGCGDLPPPTDGDAGEHWVDDVLRRRFVRLEYNTEDEVQQLSLSIDFLVELSDGLFAKREAGSSFTTFSHQAVDFILASLKNILSSEREKEIIEEIINGLVARLMKRMCTTPENAGSVDCSDAQFSLQHLFRKLGNEEFVGQRIILAISQKISNVSEKLLLADPFDDGFPEMHSNMFIMIQLIEFLISDSFNNWLCRDHFDRKLFEEWVRSILKARKDLEVLDGRNGLYVVYIERVIGRLAREVAPAAHQGKLDLEDGSTMWSMRYLRPHEAIELATSTDSPCILVIGGCLPLFVSPTKKEKKEALDSTARCFASLLA